MDTSTCSDHCRFRKEGRRPAPQQGPTRLSLSLQMAPSRTARYSIGHTSSLDQARNLCTRSRCVRLPTSSSSDARSVGSVPPEVLHIRPPRRRSVASWEGRSQAIGLPARPTLCHQAVPHKPSVRSPADGPSAPTHLTSLTTRGLDTFLRTLVEDVARTPRTAASMPRTRNLCKLVEPPAALCPCKSEQAHSTPVPRTASPLLSSPYCQ